MPTEGHRWQVDTLDSKIKRRLERALRSSANQYQVRGIVPQAIPHHATMMQIIGFSQRLRGLFALDVAGGYTPTASGTRFVPEGIRIGLAVG